jgi:hypothetical protein
MCKSDTGDVFAPAGLWTNYTLPISRPALAQEGWSLRDFRHTAGTGAGDAFAFADFGFHLTLAVTLYIF